MEQRILFASEVMFSGRARFLLKQEGKWTFRENRVPGLRLSGIWERKMRTALGMLSSMWGLQGGNER